MIFHSLILLTLSQDPAAAAPPMQASDDLSSIHWFDLDGDGDQDALAIEPSGGLRVLYNGGDGRFLDGTEASGLEWIEDARAVLLGDLNLDQTADLMLSTDTGLRLFNQSGGCFVEDTPGSFSSLARVDALGWIDANGDQRPDLHLIAAGVHHVFANETSGFRELDLGLSPTPGGALDSSPGTGSANGEAAPEDNPRPLAATDEAGQEVPGRAAKSKAPSPSGHEDFGASATVGPAGNQTTGPPAAEFCLPGVLDQSGTGCLSASTVPTLGMLYPLGNEFAIDGATGNVGIGTTTPEYALEVADQIVGGVANMATGVQASIVGGVSNSATGDEAFVGGGFANLALSERAAIAGGVGNRAAYRSFVGGGDNNAATGNLSAVAGGNQNEANQMGAFVGGGEQNLSAATHATVTGGFGNSAAGNDASVGGGRSNIATGAYSAIPGGHQNVAAGAYSYAAGRRAQALHDGAFVWGGAIDGDVWSTAPDQFIVRAAGGMGVGRVPDASFQLDIGGALRTNDTIVSTKVAGAPFQVASTTLSPNLNADLLDGVHASAFSQFGATVDTTELSDDSVTAAKIAGAAVGNSELAPDAVTSDKIASAAVGSPELAVGAVTATRIALDAVDESHLQADSVGASELQTNAVQATNLAPGSVIASKIGTGQVTLSKLDPSGGSQGQVLGHDGLSASWQSLPGTSWTPIPTGQYDINQSGTYYLPSTLTPFFGSTYGIKVNVSNVLIHLNGFTIDGIFTNGSGILVAAGVENVTVIGGTVNGFSQYGIRLGALSMVEGVTVTNCGMSGVEVGEHSIVRRVRASDNALDGITCIRGIVEQCVAVENGRDGIRATGVVTESYAYSNVESGIQSVAASDETSITDCVASRNQDGISVTGVGNVIADCTAFDNTNDGINASGVVRGCAAYQNGGSGFDLHRCFATQNFASLNTTGMDVGSDSRVEGNHTRNNSTAGYATGAGATRSLIIRNSSAFELGYSLSGDSSWGNVFFDASGGTISQSDPWLNFDR